MKYTHDTVVCVCVCKCVCVCVKECVCVCGGGVSSACVSYRISLFSIRDQGNVPKGDRIAPSDPRQPGDGGMSADFCPVNDDSPPWDL